MSLNCMYDYGKLTDILIVLEFWMGWMSWLMIRQRTRNCWCYYVFVVKNCKKYVDSLLFLCFICSFCFFCFCVESLISFVRFINFSIYFFNLLYHLDSFFLLKSLWCLIGVVHLFCVGSCLCVSFLMVWLFFHDLRDCGGIVRWIQVVYVPWRASWFAVTLTSMSLWHAVWG